MTRRNYRVVGLVPHPSRFTLELEVDGQGRRDSGEAPSEFGTFGLTPAEARIVARGLTRSGRDRRPREVQG